MNIDELIKFNERNLIFFCDQNEYGRIKRELMIMLYQKLEFPNSCESLSILENSDISENPMGQSFIVKYGDNNINDAVFKVLEQNGYQIIEFNKCFSKVNYKDYSIACIEDNILKISYDEQVKTLFSLFQNVEDSCNKIKIENKNKDYYMDYIKLYSNCEISKEVEEIIGNAGNVANKNFTNYIKKISTMGYVTVCDNPEDKVKYGEFNYKFYKNGKNYVEYERKNWNQVKVKLNGELIFDNSSNSNFFDFDLAVKSFESLLGESIIII